MRTETLEKLVCSSRAKVFFPVLHFNLCGLPVGLLVCEGVHLAPGATGAVDIEGKPVPALAGWIDHRLVHGIGGEEVDSLFAIYIEVRMSTAVVQPAVLRMDMVPPNGQSLHRGSICAHSRAVRTKFSPIPNLKVVRPRCWWLRRKILQVCLRRCHQRGHH